MLKIVNTLPFYKDTGYILYSPYRDARNLNSLLNSMTGGIDTYQRVVDGLSSKYGTNFKKLYLGEVSRG